VVPKVDCTAPWETVELRGGAVRSQVALEMSPSERIVRLLKLLQTKHWENVINSPSHPLH
jgi:hypothetical protein